MDFAVQADLRVKIKESEKINKYLDIARGLKNVKIVVWAHGTVPKTRNADKKK